MFEVGNHFRAGLFVEEDLQSVLLIIVANNTLIELDVPIIFFGLQNLTITNCTSNIHELEKLVAFGNERGLLIELAHILDRTFDQFYLAMLGNRFNATINTFHK